MFHCLCIIWLKSDTVCRSYKNAYSGLHFSRHTVELLNSRQHGTKLTHRPSSSQIFILNNTQNISFTSDKELKIWIYGTFCVITFKSYHLVICQSCINEQFSDVD